MPGDRESWQAGFQNKVDDGFKAGAGFQVGKDERFIATHLAGIPVHDIQVGADQGRVIKSILLMTRADRSATHLAGIPVHDIQVGADRVMPGPPLRGILSPAETSMT